MRKNLGVALGALALTLVLSGCTPQKTQCDLVAYSYAVDVDAGDAAVVQACIDGRCASWIVGDKRNAKLGDSVFVIPNDDGTLSVGRWFRAFEEVTITTLDDAGMQASEKTFPLEWTPPYDPDDVCTGSKSTDPITL